MKWYKILGFDSEDTYSLVAENYIGREVTPVGELRDSQIKEEGYYEGAFRFRNGGFVRPSEEPYFYAVKLEEVT